MGEGEVHPPEDQKGVEELLHLLPDEEVLLRETQEHLEAGEGGSAQKESNNHIYISS